MSKPRTEIWTFSTSPKQRMSKKWFRNQSKPTISHRLQACKNVITWNNYILGTGINNVNSRLRTRKIILPAAVTDQDGNDSNRPGWKTCPRRVIFHKWYGNVHYFPDCLLKFKTYPSILLNYEQIYTDDKERVPCQS